MALGSRRAQNALGPGSIRAKWGDLTPQNRIHYITVLIANQRVIGFWLDPQPVSRACADGWNCRSRMDLWTTSTGGWTGSFPQRVDQKGKRITREVRPPATSSVTSGLLRCDREAVSLRLRKARGSDAGSKRQRQLRYTCVVNQMSGVPETPAFAMTSFSRELQAKAFALSILSK